MEWFSKQFSWTQDIQIIAGLAVHFVIFILTSQAFSRPLHPRTFIGWIWNLMVLGRLGVYLYFIWILTCVISSIQLFYFRVVEYLSSPFPQDNRCTIRTPCLNDMGWGAPPSNSAPPRLFQWKSECTPLFLPPFFQPKKGLDKATFGEGMTVVSSQSLDLEPSFLGFLRGIWGGL